MDDYLKRFRLRIRKLRKEIKFSQERLADIAGLDRSYLGGIKRGRRNPSRRNILVISRALGVLPADLFPGKPVRIAMPDSPAVEGPRLVGYGHAVCVPAIEWIDRNLLTPLFEAAARRPS